MFESIAVRVKLKTPLAVGMPAITAEPLTFVNPNPVGNTPEVMR